MISNPARNANVSRGLFMVRTIGFTALGLAVAAVVCAGYALIRSDLVSARGLGVTLLVNAVVAGILLPIAGFRDLTKIEDLRIVVAATVWLWPVATVLAAPAFMVSEDHTVSSALFLAASNLTTTGLRLEPSADISQAMVIWRLLLHLFGAAAAIAGGGLLLSFVEDRLASPENRSQLTIREKSAARSAVEIFVACLGALVIATATGALLLTAFATPFVEALALAGGAITTGWIEGSGALPQHGFGIGLLVVLMILGSISIRRHIAFLQSGPDAYWRDPECRIAAIIVLGVAAICLAHGMDLGHSGALAVSTVTSSGLVTDATVSSLGALAVLLALVALIGGSTESTAGGLKLLRLRRLAIAAAHEISAMRTPTSAQAGGQRTLDLSLAAWGHAAAFLTVLMLTTAVLALFGLEIGSAVTLAAAALATNGQIAQLGAPQGIYALGEHVTVLMTSVMLIGRVEPLVLLATLFPRFWRG